MKLQPIEYAHESRRLDIDQLPQLYLADSLISAQIEEHFGLFATSCRAGGLFARIAAASKTYGDALVSSEPTASTTPQSPQTIRIMDLSDAQNPKVAREFTGVTALSRDDPRGLIFVANADGIWILKQHFAQDPEVQKAYEDYVIYGSSMYGPRR